ncbi:MAG: bifunctional phosphopantothenoylcysteine decarboxylase/phosphopantothenate--cysteine ligase CoaBC [Deltaproteobacteria bacterium]|nr:bifunctional phosphopantothenoylcysteine decarboxylase/phosphopantothenate--cysteine ligase CoaBC [Deltaproteobacteria bacterium]MBW1977697.1 bifunctional phosphopantothenoylcysteine decarboxylase/phosphopantothenate--cysteine ligase CoaBC [Deltaproteobacteria bacterium]MBW2045204.1 bifunctional phosphopantothenoylcysteine decarboxylase/phosphopantothenate--cysteine ligase CoaBC [Deltaproteobacteria bacterium]MBW2299469.1 bifunctional phosphopantothenoylcysteine decarboxylase/phosphopantothen
MKGKNVVVGVTGGIAAYKAAELVRLLVKAGAQTRVAMTAHATKFVTPLTFEVLSENRVVWDMWDGQESPMSHITMSQEADLIIIAPATANFIGKIAHGIADDFLSTSIVAATGKMLVCPSMNSRMLSNPAVQENITLLRKRGYTVMAPQEGELACGERGVGRLPEPEQILEQARILLSEHDLSGMKVLVTAGATVEPIDPVRYITNRSSGKMGYALARAAALRGAEVMLVSGPTSLNPPRNVKVFRVKTAAEMRDAVLGHHAECDVVIKAAAVLDYKPRRQSKTKIKKLEEIQSLELVRNPDILAELGRRRSGKRSLLVGFAAETHDLMSNAREKLRKKNLDMIIANDVSREDAGFESDTNAVKIIHRDGRVEELPLMTKEDLADRILDRVKKLWKETA